MKTISVTITGISPLLMNRPDLLEFENKVNVKKSGEELMSHQFKTKKYLTPEGKLFTPNTHIKGALVEAGKKIKVKGQGKSTYSKIFGYGLIVSPAQIIHEIQECEPFTCLAVIQKSRVPVCRPLLNKWKLKFDIEYDEDEIPLEVMDEGLNIAGKIVGIGDWRPGKKGTYGRFIASIKA